jgi:hypothetical protein
VLAVFESAPDAFARRARRRLLSARERASAVYRLWPRLPLTRYCGVCRLAAPHARPSPVSAERIPRASIIFTTLPRLALQMSASHMKRTHARKGSTEWHCVSRWVGRPADEDDLAEDDGRSCFF